MESRPSKDRKSRAGGSTFAVKNKVVFVGYFSYAIQEKELLEHFKASCVATGCRILKDIDGESKGCGFVYFSTAEEAARACSTYNGSKLRGRKIKVEIKRGRPKYDHGKSKGHKQDQAGHSADDWPPASSCDCKIWIGIYPQTATEDEVIAHISNLFARFVTTVRLVYKPSGSCGIVTFDSTENAQSAMKCMNVNSPFFHSTRLQVHFVTDELESDLVETAANFLGSHVQVRSGFEKTGTDKPGSLSALVSEDATSDTSKGKETKKGPLKFDPLRLETYARDIGSRRPAARDSRRTSAHCCDVWIGTFPRTTTAGSLKDHLTKRFANCATTVSIVHTSSGKYGIVTFSTSADAQRACLSMDGTRVLGTHVQVRLAMDKPKGDPDTVEKPAPPPTTPVRRNSTSVRPREQEMKKPDHTETKEHAQDQSAPDLRRDDCHAWIGPYPQATTEDDLMTYFSKLFRSYTNLVRVVNTSLGKYGVVTFDNPDTARSLCDCVLGMDGSYHLGTHVQVCYSTDMPGTTPDTEVDQSVSLPTPPVQGTSLSPRNQGTKKYRHSDPLVTRLMCTKLMKKIKETAEPLCVKVTPNYDGDSLALFGTMEGVADVYGQLLSLALEVENSLTETVVAVDSVHIAALSRDSLKGELCQLEKDAIVSIETIDQSLQKLPVKEAQPTASNICKLQIARGKLSDEVADGIVCPITMDFVPQPGPTEDALKAGGKSLQDEIEKYRNVCGTLKTTSAFDLPAGDLKSSKVILVVMPTKKWLFTWRLVSFLSDFRTELRTSIKNILSVADRLQMRSLSLPVLGEPGIMSGEDIARLMTSTIKEHVLKTDHSALDCVRVVTLDDKEIRTLHNTIPPDEVETGQDQSTTTHVVIKRGQWMYQDDSGRYMPFDSASNATLEKNYIESVVNSVISIGSFVYKIDLAKLTQVNKKTGKCRKLQRINAFPPDKSTDNVPPSQWVYFGRDGKYHDYDDISNSILEEAWRAQKNVEVVTVSGRAYMVDFISWTQTNVYTEKKRPIKRLATASGESSGKSLKIDNTNDSESESHLEKFIVRGQREDVVAAATKLESILKVERSTKSFLVPSSVYGAFQHEIDSQIHRLQVRVKNRVRVGSSIKIELEGVSNLVDDAIRAIQVRHINVSICIALLILNFID